MMEREPIPPVTIAIDDLLDQGDLEALKANLGVEDAHLADAIQRLGAVAFSEMFDMACGRDPEKLSSDTLEKRLQRFIQYYYVDALPTETQVSRIFQITATRATTALRNIAAKLRPQIERQQLASLRRILEGRQRRTQENLEITVQSAYLTEALKAIIEQDASGYQTVSKKHLSSDTLLLSVNTYNVIRSRFDLPEEPVEFDG